ncbi:MAG TPA: gamma-butyrobetaine hydroxylase-like domain-containing protein [Roseiarcus sp.]|nr:gamma-butyrobetaine hydroxylase-like domain-containing protein [Roseiarcus sp.]
MDKEQHEPWPTEIRLTDEGRLLTIAFDSGESFALESAYLRKMTPSVEAKRLTEAEREKLIAGRSARITAIDPIGNYAIRPTFDDGHSTGIFSWTYLAELGRKARRGS